MSARLFASSAFRMARWPLVVAASGAVFLLVGVSTARETYQVWQVDQDIRNLQSQVDTLEGKKLKFLETIQQLNSPDALDKEARARLGLRKPGERVLVLSGGGESGSQGLPTSLQPTTKDAVNTLSNPQKWFRYFFHP